MPHTENLILSRGDNYDLQLTVLADSGRYKAVPSANASGTAVDVTTAEFRFTAKYGKTQLDSAAVFTRINGTGITLTTPASGIITINFVPANTDSLPGYSIYLVYDLQMRLATKVYTLMQGKLRVDPDVSITAP